MSNLVWDELDDQAVKTCRVLAADAVENAGSGHPGTPISLAPAAYLLYQRHLRFDPTDPSWLGRDRFVLSAGHASLLQYIQLFMAGVGVEMEDLKSFRKYGSLLPGHPEKGHTKGIEITTGPLGTGVAAAVGMAMEQRRLRGLLDPDAPAGESPFDYRVYCVAGDGCMAEGVAAEASSLAGTQKLGNLVLLYDENHISIEDDTSIAFTEDVLARYAAYGWHTQRVEWLRGGDYVEDLAALHAALEAAEAETERPSIIALRTVIGWPSPNKQNTGGIHGAKLGGEELVALKQAVGFDPAESFACAPEVLAHARDNAAARGQAARSAWNSAYQAWRAAHGEAAQLLDRLVSGKLPAGWDKALPKFAGGDPLATRAASGKVLAAIAPELPELWGGSADLAGSNNTYIKGDPSFLPVERSSKAFSGNPYGRNLHFGVREHGMGGIMNGIAASGLTRVYGATFFVFSDFMRGAVRLAALMDLPVTYVWTHDSIGVGEDGPTHQPVETLTAVRAIPNLAVVRPADGDETAQAWKTILENRHPAALILTRQNLPNPARGEDSGLAAASGLAKGGYVLKDWSAPGVILMASGSEVSLALEAAAKLEAEGVGARVVSMPCMEWFAAQDAAYRESVLPAGVRARVSVEAGLALPWAPYVGDAGRSVSIETFGAPGAAGTLFEHFGITVDNIVAKAKESLAATQ